MHYILCKEQQRSHDTLTDNGFTNAIRSPAENTEMTKEKVEKEDLYKPVLRKTFHVPSFIFICLETSI